MDLCPIRKTPCPFARVVHVTELTNGKVTELHLCENCAGQFTEEKTMKKPDVELEKQKKSPKIPPGFLSLMQAILSQPLIAPAPKTSHPPCPKCGTTIEDVVNTGKFGCSGCYSHFESGATSIIARCQMGANQHVGKVPKKWAEEQQKRREEQEAALDKQERIKNLRLKMAKAIEVENYEVAGVLKKKIEELQQGTE